MHDQDELDVLGHDALRQELHAVVDGVMDAHRTAPRARETLKAELHDALDRVVHDHVAAETVRGRLAGELSSVWSTVHIVPERVDVATVRLGKMVESAVEGTKPGVKRGASTTAKLLPRVIPMVMDMLGKFADDPERMRAAQLQAEKLLVRYMEPKRARWIVAAAVKAAEAAVKTHRERGQDGGPPSLP